jgi:hypothetical protein
MDLDVEIVPGPAELFFLLQNLEKSLADIAESCKDDLDSYHDARRFLKFCQQPFEIGCRLYLWKNHFFFAVKTPLG